MIEKIYWEIWGMAKPYYEKGREYDIPHVRWMMDKAYEIADIEKADKRLLLPIVILHDVGYSKIAESNPNIKDKNHKIVHMEEGAIIAEKILSKLKYEKQLKEKIIKYISVHDNWILGDDTPFKECKEMAIFNDLDFLYTLSSPEHFTLMGKSMGMTPAETYEFWMHDEKLARRPFCCETTRSMFTEYMSARQRELKGPEK